MSDIRPRRSVLYMPGANERALEKAKTLPADSDIVTAADEFLKSPVRRLPIVDKGTLLGQVSRRDILRAAKSINPTTW